MLGVWNCFVLETDSSTDLYCLMVGRRVFVKDRPFLGCWWQKPR